jgi:diketogulonate reductase-like aldo/keto reductase
MKEHEVSLMAYSPFGHVAELRERMTKNQIVQALAEKKRCTITQILLAFVIRNENVFAIPRATRINHVRQNANASDIEFTADELTQLDNAFAPPSSKVALEII